MSEQYIKKLEDENKLLNDRVNELEKLIQDRSKPIESITSEELTKVLTDNIVKDINDDIDNDFLKTVQNIPSYKDYMNKAYKQQMSKYV